jgi:hypothetical protein
MTAQFGPHRWSAGGRAVTEIHGAELGDLRGARFVDCDMSGMKIVDSFLVQVDISGYVDNFVINGVDVSGFVNEELDRRHPERVQLRSMRTPDDFRAMWDTVERLWETDLERGAELPVAALDQRVDGEWSFVETLRHLVFVTDSWAARTILDEEKPFHRLGLPQTAYSPADAAALGIEISARPTYAEVLAVRGERMALIRRLVDELTDAELGRICERSPAPGYPEEGRPVAECLAVVMEEECDHHRFAARDLAALAS